MHFFILVSHDQLVLLTNDHDLCEDLFLTVGLFFTKTTKQPYNKTNLQRSSYYGKFLGPETHGNYRD
jgi:hypothetical protein